MKIPLDPHLHTSPLTTYSFRREPPPSANDAAGLAAIRALRYEVYCLERGFVDPALHPDRLERDEFDERAVHFSARATDERVVGGVRLVRARPGQSFPFEAHCPVYAGVALPPAEQCAEVSRLVLRRSLRGRSPAGGKVTAAFGHAPGPAAMGGGDRILLGLYREIYRYSLDAGLRYWFAAMEKPLARLLAQLGFRLRPIGPVADYAGPVRPYLADLDELAATLSARDPGLSAWFAEVPRAA